MPTHDSTHAATRPLPPLTTHPPQRAPRHATQGHHTSPAPPLHGLAIVLLPTLPAVAVLACVATPSMRAWYLRHRLKFFLARLTVMPARLIITAHQNDSGAWAGAWAVAGEGRGA